MRDIGLIRPSKPALTSSDVGGTRSEFMFYKSGARLFALDGRVLRLAGRLAEIRQALYLNTRQADFYVGQRRI
jgi:hypothetical protein